MNPSEIHPAVQYLNKSLPVFRPYWRKLERSIPTLLRERKERSLWPKTTFLPKGTWKDAFRPYLDKRVKHLKFHDEEEKRAFMDMSTDTFSTLATWRLSQGIYRLHPSVLLELVNTPIPDEFPSDVLRRLPEWCIFVDLPRGYNFNMTPVHGFWATLSWNEKIGEEALHLTFLQEDGITPTYPVPISNGSLSSQFAFGTVEENTPDKTSIEWFFTQLKRMFSIMLYICSEMPEIDNLKTPGSNPSHALRVGTAITSLIEY